MTPRPVLVPVTAAALVPTATHQAPGTPAGAAVVVVLGGGIVVLGGGTAVVGAVTVVGEAVPEAVPDGVAAVGAEPGAAVVDAPVVDGAVVDVKGRPPCPPDPRAQTMSFR